MPERQRAVDQVFDDFVDGIAAAAAAQSLVGIVVFYEFHRFRRKGEANKLRVYAPDEGRGLVLFPESLAKTVFKGRHGNTAYLFDRTVRKHDLACGHVMPRTAIYQRMGAAGVVTEHTTYAAAVARRCFWAEMS